MDKQSSKRVICAVTGTRAEYGLLRWTLDGIQQDPELELKLVVTGAHLDASSGNTYTEIEQHGFTISAKLDMRLEGDTAAAITKAMARGTALLADYFEKNPPDILLILGDRYEILAAAQAAMIAKIPIAHIHGGEATEGLIDEAIRHAVTKMSHIHYVAAEGYARRVAQLGENPNNIHTVGAAGLDSIAKIKPLDKTAIEQQLGYDIGDQHLLVTFHPVTLLQQDATQALAPLLKALQQFPSSCITITGANSDPSGKALNRALAQWCDEHENAHFVNSLGQLKYLSLARLSLAIVGNSSSGLIEIPSLGIATVNIGDRQLNRLKAPSVIDTQNDAIAITQAINKANTKEFKSLCDKKQSPYGKSGAATKIVTSLKQTSLQNILLKHFHDWVPRI